MVKPYETDMAPSNENLSNKIKELSKLKMLYNPGAITNTQNITNIVKSMNLKGCNVRQNPLRRSANFLNNNKIITPFGLTATLPNRPEVDDEGDGVGNAVDGRRSHLPRSLGSHCDKCCCKKAETSLEKLKQEVNDLKELVKNMRHSNGYQFDSYTTPERLPSNAAVPSSIPPPPPPPPPPIIVSEYVDPLQSAREAQRKKKDQILKPVQRGGVDMTEILKEMKGVTLKQVPRSPGGTPYRSKTKLRESGEDAGSFLTMALQKRFDSLASPESSPIKSANSTFNCDPS